MTKHALAVAWILCFTAAACAAEPSTGNWPAWRGAGFTGGATEGNYPGDWSVEKDLAWKIELPGRGCSTPIVWDGNIILTAPVDGRDAVVCLDWSGKTRWQTALAKERPGKHRNGSGCNPSPVTDGEFVFAYYKSGTLAGLDFAGKLLWQTNLQERFGRDTLYWDIGTSPVLTRRHVIAAVMHEGGSFLIALEKQTGKLAWKVDREYDCPIEGDHAYTTPIVIDHQGGQAIVVWGAEHVTAHRAADGKLLWSCGGFNPDRKANWVAVASAVVAGRMVIVPYGRGTHLAGVRLDGAGDVTESHRRWTRADTGAFVPTPAVSDGKLYLLGDRGQVHCIDPDSGATLWSDALPKHRSNYYASPTIADGKLYAAREDGVVFTARVDGPLEVLSENSMGEQIIASPVAVANRLLLRGERHLFCVEAP